MDEFKHEIMKYELSDLDDTYIVKIGENPVIITAVHTMKQHKVNGVKPAELFTKSISQYVAEKTNSSYYIKLKDNGIESNSIIEDEFKTTLVDIINTNNIKLVIDIHGADLKHGFDVEIGNLNNLSSDFSTVKELEESFIKKGIKEIVNNNNFKGGGITKTVYGNTDIDVLQIEISRKYRDYNSFSNIEKLCDSLIEFINQYNDKR